MGKFSSGSTIVQRHGLLTTTTSTSTHEGGIAYSLDAKSELFTLAVTSMVAESTFYEAAKDRDERLRGLIAAVLVEDPDWLQRFIPYLRQTMNMRSAPVVLACEAARAARSLKVDGFNIRRAVASACLRPDEPAEVLGYWLQKFGRPLPVPVKRGLADAAVRLYSQKAALKYDGNGGIRMGDVVALCHPKPQSAEQDALFRALIGRRLKHSDPIPSNLTTLQADASLHALPIEKRRELLTEPERLADAGLTWERLSGWLQGPMDAEAWGAIIPSMGAMALTRNLRNFDDAGISHEAFEVVARRLSDAAEIRRSRQFPYRFWTAYREIGTTRWAPVLEAALRHSVTNLPRLRGRTLVLVDVSGSMTDKVSNRSSVSRWEVGAVFAGAMVQACDEVTLVPFATHSARTVLAKTTDILNVAKSLAEVQASGQLNHGTNIWQSVRAHYAGHDRVCIFTDMQAHDDPEVRDVPLIYAFDLAGYGRTGLSCGPGRYQFAGFTDAVFEMMPLLESRDPRADAWPF